MLDLQYVPLRRFCLWLACGWQFSGSIVEPMLGRHSRYSVLMEREEDYEEKGDAG